MKKFISICLSMIMVLSTVFVDNITVYAAAKSSDNSDYEYVIISETDKTASLSNYTGTDTHLVIPSTIDGYKIVEIGYGFCEENEELRSVIIPDGVEDIGADAFRLCPRLKDITIPPSVKRIDCGAFVQNGFRYENGSVNISDLYAWCNIDFSNIGLIHKMFVYKNLYLNGSLVENLVIPDGITEIKDRSFTYCESFNSVYIPNSVKYIGQSAFAGANITAVYVNSISDFLQIECEGDLFEFGEEAWNLFANGELVTNLRFEAGTQEIGGFFEDCKSLQKVYIPGSVKYLDTSFYNCKNLSEVYIEDGVEEIGRSFYRSGNGNNDFKVVIPSSVTYINTYAFDTVARTTIIECIENSYGHTYAERTSNDTDLWGNLEYHVFDDNCDSDCNMCDYTRIASHDYSDACDGSCDYCGNIRVTEHLYTDPCDETCNLCRAKRVVSHEYEWIIDKESTCSLTGIKHEECTLCHDTRNENTIINATGVHKYDDDSDTTCNTCEHKRSPLRVCDVCDGSGKQTLEETCSNCTNGILGYTTCSVCGGSGKYGSGTTITCALCGGSGGMKDGFGKWISCFACGGDGTGVSYPTCYSCNGAKRYPKYCTECGADGKIPVEGDCKNCLGVGKIETYNITFIANGGKGGPVDQTIIKNVSTTISLETPTRDGYEFAGWGSLEKCGKQYWPGDEYTVNKDITLYALWYKIDGCENCKSTGQERVDCSSCGGSGKVYERHCSRCGSSNVTEHITGIGSLGYMCNSCLSWSMTTTSHSCYSCDGDGKKDVQCSVCHGTKGEVVKPTAPTIIDVTYQTVTLMEKKGCEYSIDGITWQESNVFTNLLPETKYTFYIRYAPTNTTPFSAVSFGATVTTEQERQYIPGDVDVNGYVEANDALLALQAATGKITLAEEQQAAADVDGTAGVTANDALIILQFATKKIYTFPAVS